jgi:hypothetical protein
MWATRLKRGGFWIIRVQKASDDLVQTEFWQARGPNPTPGRLVGSELVLLGEGLPIVIGRAGTATVDFALSGRDSGIGIPAFLSIVRTRPFLAASCWREGSIGVRLPESIQYTRADRMRHPFVRCALSHRGCASEGKSHAFHCPRQEKATMRESDGTKEWASP